MPLHLPPRGHRILAALVLALGLVATSFITTPASAGPDADSFTPLPRETVRHICGRVDRACCEESIDEVIPDRWGRNGTFIMIVADIRCSGRAYILSGSARLQVRGRVRGDVRAETTEQLLYGDTSARLSATYYCDHDGRLHHFHGNLTADYTWRKEWTGREFRARFDALENREWSGYC